MLAGDILWQSASEHVTTMITAGPLQSGVYELILPGTPGEDISGLLPRDGVGLINAGSLRFETDNLSQ